MGCGREALWQAGGSRRRRPGPQGPEFSKLQSRRARQEDVRLMEAELEPAACRRQRAPCGGARAHDLGSSRLLLPQASGRMGPAAAWGQQPLQHHSARAASPSGGGGQQPRGVRKRARRESSRMWLTSWPTVYLASLHNQGCQTTPMAGLA